MIHGCKPISRAMLDPSHQKNRVSLVLIPIKTIQATKLATDKATDKA